MSRRTPRACNDDKQRASASYSLNTVEGILQGMIQYGLATGAFTVYKDFPDLHQRRVPPCQRLGFHIAATYDSVGGTGGCQEDLAKIGTVTGVVSGITSVPLVSSVKLERWFDREFVTTDVRVNGSS